MNNLLILLKLDLGISNNARDEYFLSLIDSSKAEIERRGITLDFQDIEDQMLVSDYAAWQYRKRQEDVPLARNIIARLRNRIIKERAKR
ncbi:hypothetical protein [Sutcliffiella cohnii]|uniref:hypothetical protein n=1 Tax=Sutcliffiella cohnii TaxID=33932 RepID=UPI002E1EE154|nr:hypothetical protein [Sutcliffiella cohnii]